MRKILLFVFFCFSLGVSSMSYGQFYPGGFGGNEMAIWLQPDQAFSVGPPTFTLTNGGNVVYWRDVASLQGNATGDNATQATVADQPSYNSPVATGVYGSHSVVFDRANTEFLDIATDNAINGAVSNEKMMTMAFKTSNITHNVQFLYEEGGTTNGMAIYILQDQLYVAIWNYGDATWGAVAAGSTLICSY